MRPPTDLRKDAEGFEPPTEACPQGRDSMSENEDEAELYASALNTIEAAKQDREQQFPKIEALRASWKADLNELDGPKDPLWIRCLVDCLISEVEASLDPEKDDPVEDPSEWLEFGYGEREERTA